MALDIKEGKIKEAFCHNKVLLKYKLYSLNDYIVYNDNELFKDRFKYAYFKKLYE